MALLVYAYMSMFNGQPYVQMKHLSFETRQECQAMGEILQEAASSEMKLTYQCYGEME